MDTDSRLSLNSNLFPANEQTTRVTDYIAINDRLTYELVRSEFKLGTLATFFVLFKSCVSLGLFSYPYALGKAGVMYGVILTYICCHLTTYGMYSCIVSAQAIESKFPRKFATYQGIRGVM